MAAIAKKLIAEDPDLAMPDKKDALFEAIDAVDTPDNTAEETPDDDDDDDGPWCWLLQADLGACTSCGNGMVEGGDKCDGADLDGAGCADEHGVGL